MITLILSFFPLALYGVFQVSSLPPQTFRICSTYHYENLIWFPTNTIEIVTVLLKLLQAIFPENLRCMLRCPKLVSLYHENEYIGCN